MKITEKKVITKINILHNNEIDFLLIMTGLQFSGMSFFETSSNISLL
jgi:hypothetical protein